MANVDYFKERNNKNTERTRELCDELPAFCREFFRGVEPRTSALTRLNYAYDLRIFFDFLSKQRPFVGIKPAEFMLDDLNSVSSEHIEIFLEYLTIYNYDNKQYSNGNNGKARKLSTIRALFKYFYNKDKLERDVAAKISMPKIHEKEIIRLEPNEVADLLDTAEYFEKTNLSERQINYLSKNTKHRDVAILTLFLGTGIRISELVGLNKSDLNFDTNGFTITRKGGKRVVLYFSNEVAEALIAYLRHREASKNDEVNENTALFLSLQNKRISVRAVENLVKKYASQVTTIKNISPHKLRSTYGTELYRATGDIYVVADVLGHKDVNTTKKHYAALDDDVRRKAATKVVLRDEDDKE